MAVGAALVFTLDNLETHDFDGLNNVFQIPWALPWFLLPVGTRDHALNAWVSAGMGWFNGVIELLFGQAILHRFRGQTPR